tara:strand:+ start:28 stop:294 length:267 start_codon:yes stop_codon:yes gene_type:complete
MPRYCYFCAYCQEEFMVMHSMSEELARKDGCASQCDLKRIPQITSTSLKNKKDGRRKVGQVVNNFIEDAREELIQQKETLKKKREIET